MDVEAEIKSRRSTRRKLTAEEEEQLIKDCYSEGYTYKEIAEKYGFAAGTIARLVRGVRTVSESRRLSESKGRWKLTDKGRQVLSDNGKRACQSIGKVYTKPEQGFKIILNNIGIGVQFPDELKDKLNVVDDSRSQYSRFICFQYPLQRYVLDFVDVENKVAINVNGDYWHANPVLYNHNKLGKLQKHNVRTDKNKRVFLEKHGWTVLDIWESKIRWNVDLVLDKLRAAGIMEARRAYIAEDRVRFPSRLPDWSDRLRELWHKRHPSTDPNYVKKVKPRTTDKTGTCQHCGKEFSYRSSRVHKYCSTDCAKECQVRFVATADELLDKLKELGSYTRVGVYYGVSGNTIKKRCKKLGILTETTQLVHDAVSERARLQCEADPGRRERAVRASVEANNNRVPYFVATDLRTGKELYRFATYEELESAGFSSIVALKACRGERKTYRGMRWHRENK